MKVSRLRMASAEWQFKKAPISVPAFIGAFCLLSKYYVNGSRTVKGILDLFTYKSLHSRSGYVMPS